MFDREKAKLFTEKYGDDAYRFAVILTLSPAEAEAAVTAAFTALLGKADADSEDIDKRKVFHAVYKAAKKNALTDEKRAEIEKEYGEKPEEFFDIASLPYKKRASEHLVLYEGYKEGEAAAILKGKFND